MSFQSGESPISRALRQAGQIIGGYMQQERQRRLQEELQRGQLSQERAMQLVGQLREQLAQQYALPPGQQDRRTIANLEREIQQLGGVLDSPAREAAPVFQSATQGFDQTTQGRRTTADREAPTRRQDVEAGTGRVAEARDVTLPGLQGRAREQPTQAVIGQAAGQAASAQRQMQLQQQQAKEEREAARRRAEAAMEDARSRRSALPDQIEALREETSRIDDPQVRAQARAALGQLDRLRNAPIRTAQQAQSWNDNFAQALDELPGGISGLTADVAQQADVEEEAGERRGSARDRAIESGMEFAGNLEVPSQERVKELADWFTKYDEDFFTESERTNIIAEAGLEDEQAVRERELALREQRADTRGAELSVEEARRTLESNVSSAKAQAVIDTVDAAVARGTEDAQIREQVADALGAEASAKVDSKTVNAVIRSRRAEAEGAEIETERERRTLEDDVALAASRAVEAEASAQTAVEDVYRERRRFWRNEAKAERDEERHSLEMQDLRQSIEQSEVEFEQGQVDRVAENVLAAAETGFTENLSDDEKAVLANYLGVEPNSNAYHRRVRGIREETLTQLQAERRQAVLRNEQIQSSLDLNDQQLKNLQQDFRIENYDFRQTVGEDALDNVTSFREDMYEAVQAGNPGAIEGALTALQNPDAYPDAAERLKEMGVTRDSLLTLRDEAEAQLQRTRDEDELKQRRLRAQVSQAVLGVGEAQLSQVETMADMFETPEDARDAIQNLSDPVRAAWEEAGLMNVLESRIQFRNAVTRGEEAMEALTSLTENRPEDVDAWRPVFVRKAREAGFERETAETMADGWQSAWSRDASDLDREIERHKMDMSLAEKRREKLNLDIEDLRNPDPDDDDALSLNQFLTRKESVLESKENTIREQRVVNACYPPGSVPQAVAAGVRIDTTSEDYQVSFEGRDEDLCNSLSESEEEILRAKDQLLGLLGSPGGGSAGTANAGEGADQAQEEPVLFQPEAQGAGAQGEARGERGGGNERDGDGAVTRSGVELSQDAADALDEIRNYQENPRTETTSQPMVLLVKTVIDDIGEERARELIFGEGE